MSKTSSRPSPVAAEISTTPGGGAAATPAPQPAADPHAGKGGHYELVDGVRRLVERTGAVTDTPKAESAD